MSVSWVVSWAGRLKQYDESKRWQHDPYRLDRTALTAALVVCGIQLVGWGFAVGRRADDRWYQAVLSALANGLLGFTLVALEVRVLH